jgi:hypothetical protein
MSIAACKIIYDWEKKYYFLLILEIATPANKENNAPAIKIGNKVLLLFRLKKWASFSFT